MRIWGKTVPSLPQKTAGSTTEPAVSGTYVLTLPLLQATVLFHLMAIVLFQLAIVLFHINLAAGHTLMFFNSGIFPGGDTCISPGHAFLVPDPRLLMFETGGLTGRQLAGAHTLGNTFLLLLLYRARVFVIVMAVQGLRLREACR